MLPLHSSALSEYCCFAFLLFYFNLFSLGYNVCFNIICLFPYFSGESLFTVQSANVYRMYILCYGYVIAMYSDTHFL